MNALTLFLSSTVLLILINNINFIYNYQLILIIIGYSLIIDNKYSGCTFFCFEKDKSGYTVRNVIYAF